MLEFVERGRGATSDLGRRAVALLDTLGVDSPALGLALLLVLAFIPLAARSAVQYARDLLAGRLKFRLVASLRKQASEAFLLADSEFILEHDRALLFSALTTEAERAAEALATRLVFIAALAMVLVYAALLFLVSPRLALWALPAFVIVGAVFRRVSSLNRRLGDSFSALNAQYALQLGNRLHGIDRIKMRGWELEIAAELASTADRITARRMGIERLRLLVEMTMHPVVVLAAFGVVYLAVVHLHMTLASLGLFLFIMVRLVPQLTLMNGIWAHMHGFMGSHRRLAGLVGVAREHVEPRGGGRAVGRLQHAIAYDRISYGYPSAPAGELALRDLSFSLARGSLTAVVGRSGAGKSTLAALLTGFFRPQHGRIVIDGVPLAELDLRSLRRRVAVVPQEPYLFNESVRSNLVFGLEGTLHDDTLEEVLDRAHCLDFVARLPAGLDTVVGERGVLLSQGQRQRLAIAHALACEAEILVLDEPTSALDPDSERAISQTLSTLKGRLTILVIAHRLATIRDADQVLVLDGGRLVDHGSHGELAGRCDLYRTLFEDPAFRPAAGS